PPDESSRTLATGLSSVVHSGPRVRPYSVWRLSYDGPIRMVQQHQYRPVIRRFAPVAPDVPVHRRSFRRNPWRLVLTGKEYFSLRPLAASVPAGDRLHVEAPCPLRPLVCLAGCARSAVAHRPDGQAGILAGRLVLGRALPRNFRATVAAAGVASA